VIGKTVSHYKITRELGAGGMGVVYEATDTRLDRTVALKFLAPELSRDQVAKDRFKNEARAASSLEHGAICTIHEIDETEDGQLFLVMPRYEGETLRERMDRGPLPSEEASNIILQLSKGLAKAHDRGLVHRDIKPDNIFLTIDGEVRLLDFGLAKLVGATRLTLPGTTLGTIGYLSPEQAGGQEASSASDIWALGIVLREMVTGRPVFAGDHPQAVLYAIQNVEPDSIPTDVDELSPDLQGILDRCLQKDQAKRFQNAGELVSALAGQERPVKPPSWAPWIPGLAAIVIQAGKPPPLAA
jgi:serine/threonine protein kinase